MYGLDAIIGLVLPGIGDVIGSLLGLYIMSVAIRRRVSTVVVVRMLTARQLDAAHYRYVHLLQPRGPAVDNGVASPRMYAIALIRYRKPLEQVLTVLDEHRAYLMTLKEKGILLVSGPLDPRSGGALLLRVPDHDTHAALDQIRDADPFTLKGMAQYELLPWATTIGTEDLDRL